MSNLLENAGVTLEDYENSDYIYKTLGPQIQSKVKEPSTWSKILKLTQDFMSKNMNALSTNIVGRRVLLNAKTEEEIYDAFRLEKSEVRKTILTSPYFKVTFGKEISLTDQLCLAFPLIIASLEYKLIGKKEESELCYLLAHFKPYASREFYFFKYGVKENQMLYTIEKGLSERYDIKKYGTIINVLKKRSQSSYENYILNIKKGDAFTDKQLYRAYTSGIVGAVNNFLNGIAAEYKKNEGKSLDFELAIKGVMDKDSDSTEYEDNDIQSDTAVKMNIVNKVLLNISKNPVNKSVATSAAAYGFESSSRQYVLMLENTVAEITDHYFSKLPEFFGALISSFLFHQKPGSNEMYTMEDFKSPIFISVGIDILAGKKPNVKDNNMLMCRQIMRNMLETYSEGYAQYGESYQRKFGKALAAYWVYLIKITR